MNQNRPPGLIIAAPASGSGKTLFTQALLRLLKNSGYNVAPAKIGPDYIDPHFHTRASGRECINLDSWAMRKGLLTHLLERLTQGSDIIVCEGVMGLFDGAGIDDGLADGSTASIARQTGWPVILIVDAAKQAQSVAALVRGFVTHSPDVQIAGVVFNRVGSPNHEAILRNACARHLPEIPILGALPKNPNLVLPERHLGLVQAQEHLDHETFLETAADWLGQHLDAATLFALALPAQPSQNAALKSPLKPLGNRIAVAQDLAFAFSYPTLLSGWRAAGAEITFFSPLSGEHPDAHADAVYLPGGYPELHAGQLANNGFLDGLCKTAKSGAVIYGECGGYMVLGQGLVDGEGTRHKMAALLPIETSFASPKLHLGYRQVTLASNTPFGLEKQRFRGHEFHYASVEQTTTEKPLFFAYNAVGDDLGAVGHVSGNICGSFIHLLDQSDDYPI